MQGVSFLVEILPLIGLSDLQFGDSKGDLLSKFGTPTSIENEGGNNICSSEIYKYASLGLDVYFDIDAKFVVWGFSVSSEMFTLKGLSPIGMSESELIRSYPDLVIEVSDGRFKDYINNDLGLLFFLRDSIVARLDINPNLDNYTEALNETEPYKSMKTDIWEKRPSTAYRKCYTHWHTGGANLSMNVT